MNRLCSGSYRRKGVGGVVVVSSDVGDGVLVDGNDLDGWTGRRRRECSGSDIGVAQDIRAVADALVIIAARVFDVGVIGDSEDLGSIFGTADEVSCRDMEDGNGALPSGPKLKACFHGARRISVGASVDGYSESDYITSSY